MQMSENQFKYFMFDGFEYNGEMVTPHEVANTVNKLLKENKELKSTLYYLLNVIQNKCSKEYPICKEIVRNCFENDFNNIENSDLVSDDIGGQNE